MARWDRKALEQSKIKTPWFTKENILIALVLIVLSLNVVKLITN